MNIIEQALGKLQGGKNWCKRAYIQTNIVGIDSYCAVGAIRHTEEFEGRTAACLTLAAVIREQHPEFAEREDARFNLSIVGGPIARLPEKFLAIDRAENLIVQFNDRPDTTYADIEAIFEKAAVREVIE